ncbi:MAG: UDP-N-acetylglucosamine 2-epimerase (non-hydrolyzing) [Armatimonadia bacterium]
MMPTKIALVFGTRPEAVKLAPLYHELRRREGQFQVEAIVTAQHREMLDQMLHAFDIVPSVDLNIMQPEQTLADITSRALTLLQPAFAKRSPDMVIVQGDTCTAFAAGLAAYYERIPVGHVEAGLRTNDKYSPFPEEIYRRLVGVLADVHFAATRRARHNLLGEGVNVEKIYVTGNPVVDSLYTVLERGSGLAGTELAWVDDLKGRVCLLTAHRRESLGVPLTRIFLAVKELIERFSDLHVIFPVHKNPKVQRAAEEILGSSERVVLCDPVDYLTFVPLMARADIIITDSGGVQEEAPALGVPVIVVRDTTERPEGVAAGVAKLVGTETERIVAEVSHLLNNPNEYRRMASLGCPYGDGKASARICDALEFYFGMRDARPADFDWQPGQPPAETSE